MTAQRRTCSAPAELGLRRPAWAVRRHWIWFVLALLAMFVAAALVDAVAPLATLASRGMPFEDIMEHVRRHEYRYTYGRLEPPPAAWNIAVEFIKGVVLAPLADTGRRLPGLLATVAASPPGVLFVREVRVVVAVPSQSHVPPSTDS